jgi:hypothetical protein
MKQLLPIFIFFLLIFTSCQKELSIPDLRSTDSTAEKVVAAIVIEDLEQNDYDSIVYRYFPDKTLEVHYDQSGDSVTRTYYYDVNGRLAKMEDEEAIYYTNNDAARRISFNYNSSGELVQTSTDFTTVSGVEAHFHNSFTTGNNVTVYDTAYRGSSYNLDWANRIIYNTLTTDSYLLYDSCISVNNSSGFITTYVSAYTYDAAHNATTINKFTYQDGQLSEWGTITVRRDKPAPVYEALRKKLFRDLANWYEVGSVSQDDNFRLFSIPGNMYKTIVYNGYSTNGGPAPLPVNMISEYNNTYDKDLLVNSVNTVSFQGQGNIDYVHHIRYYYR